MSDEWDLAASCERAPPLCKDGVTIAGDLNSQPAVGKRVVTRGVHEWRVRFDEPHAPLISLRTISAEAP